MKTSVVAPSPAPVIRKKSFGFFSFQHWTVRRRVGIGFAIIIAFSVVQAAISWRLLTKADEEMTQLSGDTLPGAAITAEIMRTIADIQLLVANTLLSENAAEAKALRDAIEPLRIRVLDLTDQYGKTLKNEDERVEFAAMIETRTAYIATRGKVFSAVDGGSRSDAMKLYDEELAKTYRAYRAALLKMSEREATAALASAAATSQASHTARTVNLWSALVVIATGLIAATSIVMALSRILSRLAASLSDGSDQVASAAGQVSSASQTLAEGANEQAASLEETGSSLEEMASMTHRNSDSARKASDLARQAREAADAGSADMRAMQAAMAEIKTSSDDIAKIVKTIDEIAFQTNILALNAAVEAARAGSAGAGFAVVADEVRALAQRSAQSAKETAEKIEGAIHKAAQGVEISTKVGTGLESIVEKVRQVDQLITEVSTASAEQNQGISQINSAVSQMDKVVQGAASNAEETAASAEELTAQAYAMRETVDELLALVNGQKTRAGGAAPDKSQPAWRDVPHEERRPTAAAAKLVRTAIPNRSAPSVRKAKNGANVDDLSFRDL